MSDELAIHVLYSQSRVVQRFGLLEPEKFHLLRRRSVIYDSGVYVLAMCIDFCVSGTGVIKLP